MLNNPEPADFTPIVRKLPVYACSLPFCFFIVPVQLPFTPAGGVEGGEGINSLGVFLGDSLVPSTIRLVCCVGVGICVGVGFVVVVVGVEISSGGSGGGFSGGTGSRLYVTIGGPGGGVLFGVVAIGVNSNFFETEEEGAYAGINE